MPYPSFLKSLALNTPILRDVVAERDRLRKALERTLARAATLQDRGDATQAMAHGLQQQVDALAAEKDRLERHVAGADLRHFTGNERIDQCEAALSDLRRDCARLLRERPLFRAADLAGYARGLAQTDLSAITSMQSALLQACGGQPFQVNQFCLCCIRTTPMLVDFEYGYRVDGQLLPNWRERLVCPGCGMNNRQRLVAKLVDQRIGDQPVGGVYFMEQITPIFRWVRDRHPGVDIVGSEYLGYQYRGGEIVNGVRHEDVMALSFDDASIGLIVSNDVLEHVPLVDKAIAECARILQPGGSMIATIPFQIEREASQVRARLGEDGIEHLLPPAYHGDPLSADGILVFHDFGWDLLDVFRRAGFASIDCEFYASAEFGHLGSGQLVFWAVKAPGAVAA